MPKPVPKPEAARKSEGVACSSRSFRCGAAGAGGGHRQSQAEAQSASEPTTQRPPLPEWQRRHEGLGLWRMGFDGVKNWAYCHIAGDGASQAMYFAMVFRLDDGVLDTLHWEGFREGVDDVRYLTTL